MKPVGSVDDSLLITAPSGRTKQAGTEVIIGDIGEGVSAKAF